MNRTAFELGALTLEYSPATGQLLRVFDRALDMQVIEFEPGSELEINRLPLTTEWVAQDPLTLGISRS